MTTAILYAATLLLAAEPEPSPQRILHLVAGRVVLVDVAARTMILESIAKDNTKIRVTLVLEPSAEITRRGDADEKRMSLEEVAREATDNKTWIITLVDKFKREERERKAMTSTRVMLFKVDEQQLPL